MFLRSFKKLAELPLPAALPISYDCGDRTKQTQQELPNLTFSIKRSNIRFFDSNKNKEKTINNILKQT